MFSSCVQLRYMTLTDQIKGHAQHDERTSHLIFVAEPCHDNECTSAYRLDRDGEQIGFGVAESHSSDDLGPM
jgi:hypothetical protein